MTDLVTDIGMCPICRTVDFTDCEHTLDDVRNFRAGKPVAPTSTEIAVKAERRALAERIWCVSQCGEYRAGQRYMRHAEERIAAIERVLEGNNG